MSQPGSIQGQLNEAREQLAAARALNLEIQAQYDRLLRRCRYAEGVVRDLHARCEVAAKSLGEKP